MAGDWRTDLIARVRTLIHDVDPEVVEEAKWKKATNPDGVPTWSRDGLICTGEIYKDKVKLTFMNGSAVEDPDKLFTGGFDGTRRVIDILEGATLDERKFKALIQRAIDVNVERAAAKRSK